MRNRHDGWAILRIVDPSNTHKETLGQCIQICLRRSSDRDTAGAGATDLARLANGGEDMARGENERTRERENERTREQANDE